MFAPGIATHIRKLRRAQELKQSELAAAVGISQALLSAIEKGRRQIQPWHVEPLAVALGVSPRALLRNR